MDELSALAKKYGSDKYGHHNYTPFYNLYLSPLKNNPLCLIELGVGGYQFVDRGGQSLKMWEEYFPQGRIVGVDIYDKSFLNNGRIKTYIGSQTDREFLYNLVVDNGPVDVILDDASHNSGKTIESFKILFPLLRDGGIYIVEDTHTSGWDSEEYEGNSNPDEGHTTLNFFKKLTDQLNWEVWQAKYRNEFAESMEYIHFYKEFIVIKKK